MTVEKPAAPISPRLLRKRRLQLIALFAIFVVPVAGSWILFYTVDLSKLSKGNYGELVQPVRPLPLTDFRGPADETVAAEILRGHWSLLQLGIGPCGEVCRDNLFKTRQVHARLNKDMGRVQRVMIQLDGYEQEDAEYFRLQQPDLTRLSVDSERVNDFLSRFSFPEAPDAARSGRVFLIDPMGNLMMWYRPDQDPSGLLKDLTRLLKYSQVG
ncbi:MAG: SCO family protein [Chromatiales bacterium]|nr:SCO family protein [Chromatiales bacterium]